MTNRQALKDLLEKVEAGEQLWEGFGDYPEIIDYHCDLIAKAFNGSLDAAKALHETVLPGWVIDRIGQRSGGVWEAKILQLGPNGWHETGDLLVSVFNADPARALLAADIKALIAQEEKQG